MSLCVIAHDQPTETSIGGLCERHRRQLDNATSEIGMLWCELNLTLDGSAPREHTQKTRHLKAAEAPAPLDLTAVALRDKRTSPVRLAGRPENPQGDQSEPLVAVPAVIAGWVTQLADERHLTATLPKGVVPQLALLERHHDWIAAQDWVDAYLEELLDVRKHLKAAIHDVTHTLVGYCDLPTDERERCGGRLLVENGSSVVRCRNCNATWASDVERARLAVRIQGVS